MPSSFARVHSIAHVRIHFVLNPSTAQWTGGHDSTKKNLAQLRGRAVRVPLRPVTTFVPRIVRSGDDVGLFAIERDPSHQRLVIQHVILPPTLEEIAKGETVQTGDPLLGARVEGHGVEGTTVRTDVDVNSGHVATGGLEGGVVVTDDPLLGARVGTPELDAPEGLVVRTDPETKATRVLTGNLEGEVIETSEDERNASRVRTKD